MMFVDPLVALFSKMLCSTVSLWVAVWACEWGFAMHGDNGAVSTRCVHVRVAIPDPPSNMARGRVGELDRGLTTPLLQAADKAWIHQAVHPRYLNPCVLYIRIPSCEMAFPLSKSVRPALPQGEWDGIGTVLAPRFQAGVKVLTL